MKGALKGNGSLRTMGFIFFFGEQRLGAVLRGVQSKQASSKCLGICYVNHIENNWVGEK